MKCPNCHTEIPDSLADFSRKGGKASKRTITPEQQAMMQKARKKSKRKEKA